MRLVNNFRNILTPAGVGIFVLITFSIVFVVGYVFIDYQKYLKSYQASQALPEFQKLSYATLTTLISQVIYN